MAVGFYVSLLEALSVALSRNCHDNSTMLAISLLDTFQVVFWRGASEHVLISTVHHGRLCHCTWPTLGGLESSAFPAASGSKAEQDWARDILLDIGKRTGIRRAGALAKREIEIHGLENDI